MTDSDSEVQFKLRGTNTDHGSSEPSRPPSVAENAKANVNNSYVTVEENDEPQALPASNTHEVGAGDDEFSTPAKSPNIQKIVVYRHPLDSSVGLDQGQLGTLRNRPRRQDVDTHVTHQDDSDSDTDEPVRNSTFKPRTRLLQRGRSVDIPRYQSNQDAHARHNQDHYHSVSPQVPYDASRYQRHHSPRPHRYRRSISTPAHNLPVLKPDFYTGEEDWESYFSHFSNCADLGRWTDTEKALTLASCLKGPARTFYLGLREQERRSYFILVQRLNERFGSSRQQTRYLTKFETRRRQAGETSASFGDDLRLIAQRAYPDLGPEAQDKLALHQFFKTISP